PGVTAAAAKDTLLAQYNDLDSVERQIEANKGQIAALIVEPVAGNMGCIPPKEGFLEGLREICSREEIVLIFDEVMTGFRLAPGGAQEYYGVTADLVTLGKIIGGGMPVGAFGGKREIMDSLAPVGPVYQAGTLSGNPIAMISGLTTLRYLDEHPEVYEQISAFGERLAKGLAKIFAGTPHQINQVGSMISIHFCEAPVVDFSSAQAGDNDTFKRFFHHMLDSGVYLPPSAYESWFLCQALTEGQIEHLLSAAQAFAAQ
ncbi:MAG: aminotransferase class III-fold pyridoxal phosphate-dependent enzyme, partial [Bacteroidota bacterium]